MMRNTISSLKDSFANRSILWVSYNPFKAQWLQILANDQLDALFHVFIYLFHLSTCFENYSAHHQEIELY